MTLDDWDLADPARLVAEIADSVPLISDTAHLAAVERPSTEQLLLHVQTLPTPARIHHHDDVRRLLAQTVRERMPVPPLAGSRANRTGIRHALVTVLVREGFTVMTRNEARWLKAWRYSNHMACAYDNHLIVVTEHGWYHWPSGRGAAEPRMLPCTQRSAATSRP